MSAPTNGTGSGPAPGDLSISMDVLLGFLADAHAAQLSTANLDAAKWRAAAAGAAAELATLRRELAALRGSEPIQQAE